MAFRSGYFIPSEISSAQHLIRVLIVNGDLQNIGELLIRRVGVSPYHTKSAEKLKG